MSDEVKNEVAEEKVSEKAEAKAEKSSLKVYELGYHLVPSLLDEGALKEAGNLREEIVKLGGVIIAEELPKAFELAYEMTKPIANKKQSFTNSYFGWIKFEMDPLVCEKWNKTLVRDDRLVRYLLISTVAENTIIGKRINTRTEGTRKKLVLKREAEEPAVEINKEEVDKKLDELLGEE
jgi:hypothetical protein